MKIKEFIEIVNSGKNKMLKADQLQQLVTKTINTKKYIGIKEKRVLIDNIVNGCILYEDGVFKFDEIDKYIAFTMKTIAAYTNLELSDDIEDDYDALCDAKLLGVVIETFNGEYENVNLLLQMKCDYILSGNNTEAQFGKFLTGILDRVDDFTGILFDKIKDFDLNNLPVNIEDLNKLMEFVNSQRK